jgi:chromosome segregation ATPase
MEEENIIISFCKEIPFPHNYEDLKDMFLNYFGESKKKNYIFFVKDKSNKEIEIKNEDNIKDILKEKDKLIFVKIKEEENDDIDFKEINLDCDEGDVKSIDNNLDEPIMKLTKIQSGKEKETSEEIDEIIKQLKSCQNNLDAAKKKNKELISKNKILKREIEELQLKDQNKDQLNDLLQNYKEQIEKLEKIVNENKNEINKLQKEKEDLTKIGNKNKKEIEDLDIKLEEANNLINQYKEIENNCKLLKIENQKIIEEKKNVRKRFKRKN